jgi:hypothetical protein
MAIKSNDDDVKNAKLMILARRIADDFPWVSQHLVAIAGG